MGCRVKEEKQVELLQKHSFRMYPSDSAYLQGQQGARLRSRASTELNTAAMPAFEMYKSGKGQYTITFGYPLSLVQAFSLALAGLGN